jgi:putative addiction module component (TIGR02574 family)
MVDLVDDLSKQANSLSEADRARLAELLLESIHVPLGDDVNLAWDAEIKSRIEEITQGRVALIPAADVFAQARSALQ